MSATIEVARQRAARVKLMAFDVDGVLSDGSLFYTDDGIEIKTFNTLDGLGMKLLQRAGLKVAVITGRKAACVERRMENLGVELLFQGVEDKLKVMRELAHTLDIPMGETGYMGDDIVDLKIMGACGFSATPSDGYGRVAQYADYVSSRAGGRGAAREVCDFILEAQGKLDAMLAPHLPEERR